MQIQALQAALEFSNKKEKAATERITELVKQRDNAINLGDEWKQLYLSEKRATTALASSNLNFQVAAKHFETGLKLSEDIIKKQNRQIRGLKIEKYIYSGVSFAGGITTGYFIGKSGVKISF